MGSATGVFASYGGLYMLTRDGGQPSIGRAGPAWIRGQWPPPGPPAWDGSGRLNGPSEPHHWVRYVTPANRSVGDP